MPLPFLPNRKEPFDVFCTVLGGSIALLGSDLVTKRVKFLRSVVYPGGKLDGTNALLIDAALTLLGATAGHLGYGLITRAASPALQP
jgi:hypothetical protein